MLENGDLLPADKLHDCYALFQSRFGPDRLKALDGEELLNMMHSHGNHDSLVYWLEFKNDDEFPAIFGSIAGGNALKFGIYKRKETGTWMTGHASNQVEITIEDAIQIARKHRDQLVAGSGLLQKLPANGTDADYATLQQSLADRAPDVSGTAWGHKYFSLIHPDKLDDFHVEGFQRFHLIKLLQKPPGEEGRYVAAGRYVAIAAELGIPINHLTTILNRTNGRPYRVWRIGTRLAEHENIWSLMCDIGSIAIGWDGLGNLEWVTKNKDSKERLKAEMRRLYYPDNQSVATRKAGEVFNFVAGVDEGDLVVAADGDQILAVGRVTGPYAFDPATNAGAPHRRPTDWLDTSKWRLPTSEGLQTTFLPLRNHPENLVAVEERLLDPRSDGPAGASKLPARSSPRLEGVTGRLQAILERKGQAILYGPPGTGKTYWARRTAFDLAALGAFGKSHATLDAAERRAVEGAAGQPGLVRVCTFHPGYGYEDFLEGYRPSVTGSGQLAFERRDGIFKSLCLDAARQSDRKFFLLIDEINRGDIPRIFGELITLLEKDKRGHALHLPVSGERFVVPPNVHVIGTMNTAERSIALLDTALRRRFGFVELLPDPHLLAGAMVNGSIPLGAWLTAINRSVREHVGRDARNLQIGHAYFLEDGRPITDLTRFSRVLAEDIVPLLEEYCYEDFDALERILGPGLFDKRNQRVKEELLLSSQSGELVQALLAPFPEILTSGTAVAQAEEDTGVLDSPDEDEPEE